MRELTIVPMRLGKLQLGRKGLTLLFVGAPPNG